MVGESFAITWTPVASAARSAARKSCLTHQHVAISIPAINHHSDLYLTTIVVWFLKNHSALSTSYFTS
jgi:hypothetical protein